MKQANFTDIEYQARKRVTKREKFLQTMDSIIPWKEWAAYIQSFLRKKASPVFEASL